MVALAECKDDSKSALVNLREECARDMRKLTDENIQIIIDKQFETVGATAPPFKDLPREWYLQHTWNIDSETEFKSWLTGYLTKIFKISKKIASYEALSWVFNYGFTHIHKPLITEKD